MSKASWKLIYLNITLRSESSISSYMNHTLLIRMQFFVLFIIWKFSWSRSFVSTDKIPKISFNWWLFRYRLHRFTHRLPLHQWLLHLSWWPPYYTEKQETSCSRTILCSRAEAECRAKALTVSELIWLRMFLSELGISTSLPMQLYCANQAALYIANNLFLKKSTAKWCGRG